MEDHFFFLHSQTLNPLNYELVSLAYDVTNNEPFPLNVSIQCVDRLTFAAEVFDSLRVHLHNVNEAPQLTNSWQTPGSSGVVLKVDENLPTGSQNMDSASLYRKHNHYEYSICRHGRLATAGHRRRLRRRFDIFNRSTRNDTVSSGKQLDRDVTATRLRNAVLLLLRCCCHRCRKPY